MPRYNSPMSPVDRELLSALSLMSSSFELENGDPLPRSFFIHHLQRSLDLLGAGATPSILSPHGLGLAHLLMMARDHFTLISHEPSDPQIDQLSEAFFDRLFELGASPQGAPTPLRPGSLADQAANMGDPIALRSILRAGGRSCSASQLLSHILTGHSSGLSSAQSDARRADCARLALAALPEAFSFETIALDPPFDPARSSGSPSMLLSSLLLPAQPRRACFEALLEAAVTERPDSESALRLAGAGAARALLSPPPNCSMELDRDSAIALAAFASEQTRLARVAFERSALQSASSSSVLPERASPRM